jgi:hypothetical protein
VKASDRQRTRDLQSPLIAAAMLARDGQFAVDETVRTSVLLDVE